MLLFYLLMFLINVNVDSFNLIKKSILKIRLPKFRIFNPMKIFKFNLKNEKNEKNENKDLQYNITEESKNTFYCYGTFPRLDSPNNKGELTWYPIGFSKDFGVNPTRVTIRDVNYVVWRDKTSCKKMSLYYGIRDVCSHQGSSFMLGNTCKNTISCPYHGYIFDGSNGELLEIPKFPHVQSQNQNIDCFKVVERGDVVYFNTIPIENKDMKMNIDEDKIFVEPEYYDKTQRVLYLSEDFENYAKFVSVNSLDICHIGFVHTFGNKKSPNPISNSNIIKMGDIEHHYKILYNYLAGENSLVNKIYNYNNITVENEYILPHSTVARVRFGGLSSTIITHALPISKFKTKLFVKTYRNYWSYNLNSTSLLNLPNILLYPFLYVINLFGDKITENTMYSTLKQDKAIVDNIDKTSYKDSHGKFSILYDMFSNHYKNRYAKYYENGPFTM